MIMMSNPEGLAINVEVEVAENNEQHLTSIIAAILVSKVSDILLLSAAAICGLMETLSRRWTDYFSPAVFGAEANVLPRPTLGFLIMALIALAEIKSQTGSPFQTHPRVTKVSVNSLLIYGFASAAEHVFYAPGVDPPSIYAIVARLGRIASLYILIASLAFPLYF